jgi:hypothetical protein
MGCRASQDHLRELIFFLTPVLTVEISDRLRTHLEASSIGPMGCDRELEEFGRLQARLPLLWANMAADDGFTHTSVVVPSLSVDQQELAKIEGSAFYEERLLLTLIRLANPVARLLYVSSQPIHPDILEYYLQHLPGIPIGHAMERLNVLCLYDSEPRPLTEKILERPRVLERIRDWVGDPDRAYLTCYNSTPRERRLAVELGLPLNSVDPSLLHLGTKSGSRAIFEEAGVRLPAGTNDVTEEEDVVRALVDLSRKRPGVAQAMVKLNESFAGEGNALFSFPEELPEDDSARAAVVRAALPRLDFMGAEETYGTFLAKLAGMGGIVEERIVAEELLSPSVQLRIQPNGNLVVVSTHDQVLGGSSGQKYVGCRFPADEAYRARIEGPARRVGQALARHGVVGRFGIDFVVSRDAGGPWTPHAIEINLRMGGTTPPFMALEFLTGGHLDPETGLFQGPDGRPKYYLATDNLKSPSYRGLLPEDLMELLVIHGLQFKYPTMTGVLFYMIGGLSQFGKLGVISVGNSREEADRLYSTTVAILDHATGADVDPRGVPDALFAPRAGTMME